MDVYNVSIKLCSQVGEKCCHPALMVRDGEWFALLQANRLSLFNRIALERMSVMLFNYGQVQMECQLTEV